MTSGGMCVLATRSIRISNIMLDCAIDEEERAKDVAIEDSKEQAHKREV